MSSHDQDDSSPVSGHADPTLTHLLSDLESACVTRMPAHQRAFIGRALVDEAHRSQNRPSTYRFTLLGAVQALDRSGDRRNRQAIRRLTSLAAILCLAVTSVMSYLRAQGPTPVSAAQLLHRARLALMSSDPNTVVHEVSVIQITPNPHGRTVGVPWLGNTPDGRLVREAIQDSWAQYADNHTILRLDSAAEDSAGRTLYRVVGTDDGEISYNGRDNTVTITPWERARDFLKSQDYGIGLPANIPLPAAVVQQLLQGKEPQQAPGDVTHLLGQQTLEGATVDVVQVVHPVPYAGPDGTASWQQIFTYYIDAHTYIIHRSIVKTLDEEGHVLGLSITQLVRHDVLSSSSVPRRVFAFTAPPNSCVYTMYPYQSPGSVPPSCLPMPPEAQRKA